MLKKDEIGRIHSAMEKYSGNFTKAAAELGIALKRLYYHVERNEDLRLKWGHMKGGLPPTSTELELNRSNIPEVTHETDIQVAKREMLALSNGLKAIGVNDKSAERLVSMVQFQRAYYKESLQALGGGLMKLFTDLLDDRERITKELEEGGRIMPKVESGQIVNVFVPLTAHREMTLRQDRASITESIQRVSDRGNKAAMTQAVIKHKLTTKRTENNKPKGYLKIEAHAGSKVQVAHLGTEMEEMVGEAG